MPLIEELPVTATVRASHGWAYVPEAGPIAAVQPGTRDRKRFVTGRGPGSASAALKLQKAIQQRLESLNKENYKDGVSVPIPPRATGKEKTGKKMSSNVRRILTYQRGFAHYLADEEANASSNTGGASSVPHVAPPPSIMPPPAPVAATQRTESKSKRGGHTPSKAEAPVTPRPGRGRRGRPPKRNKVQTTAENIKDEDTEMTDAPDTEEANTSAADENITPANEKLQNTPPITLAQVEPLYNPEWDRDPLLKSLDVPKMPSERVMKALLAEPPLSYNAARAKAMPEDEQRPKRHFCTICGYWGRVKCKKCEEWTCGISECWNSHSSVCSMANVY